MTYLKTYLAIFSFFIYSSSISTASDIKFYDIVIVGGGLSGLNAARTIYEKHPGAKIAIIEGRDRLGGRTHTLTMPDSNIVEAGGEFIGKDQEFIQKVLAELGLEKTPVTLDGDILSFYDKEKISLNETASHIGTLLDKLRPIEQNLSDSDSSSFNDSTKQRVYFDLHSCLNLGDFEKFLLQAIVRDEYGIDLSKAPLRYVKPLIERLEKYKTIIQAKTEPKENNNLATAQYRIKGGTQSLVRALSQKIPQESIFLKTCLKFLSRQGDQYKLQITDGRIFMAKGVILSTPFSVLKSQFGILDDNSLGITPRLRETIDTMVYGTNSKLITPAQELNPTCYILNTNQGGMTAWENPAGMTWMLGGTPGAQLVESSPIINEVLQTMSLIMNTKRITSSKPIIVNWNQDPLSRGSYSTRSINTAQLDMYERCCAIRELCEFAHPLNNSTLFFIGEHTCYPEDPHIGSASMESALYSGHIIGNYIITIHEIKKMLGCSEGILYQ